LVVSGLFVVLRRLEQWLHQHIFKVGWLITKDFQTTTILYYTFLLPGVVLHEVVYWLAAGFLNIRAEQAIQWPQAQQIGRLELNFIKLSRKASPLQIALISAAPFVVGVLCVWLIANNIFAVPAVLATIAPGTLPDVAAGVQQLVQAPDFWLWFYIAFSIANTMTPELKDLGGMRIVLPIFVVVTVVLAVIGVGDEIIVGFFGGPIARILNVLSSTFAVIIVMDIFVVGILSVVENTIELITGDSADFRKGKMITMTREERMSARMREIERQRRARERRRSASQDATAAGPPSIYHMPLPLPGSPGDVPVTSLQQVMVEEEEAPSRPRERPERAGAPLIHGEIKDDEERADETKLPSPEDNESAQ
jgi:hypothetical protein